MFPHYHIKCEQVQFCENSHCCTYFLVTKRCGCDMLLVLAKSYSYSHNFCKTTSTWCQFKCIWSDLLKISRTVHLHIALMKLSNCCTARLFRWMRCLQTAQTSISQSSWLADTGDHAAAHLPYRRPQCWWTETAADIGYSKENLKIHTGVTSPPFLPSLTLPSPFPLPCLPSLSPFPSLPISPFP